MNTVTTLRKKTCWVGAFNLIRTGIYLSAGLQIGKISSATVDLTRYIHQVSANEIKVDKSGDLREEVNVL